jgi:serine/threonine protein kinase
LCSAIKLINDQGFIHCDLKLENLMIEFTENIPKLKLIDFGSTFQVDNGLPKIVLSFLLRQSLLNTCLPNCSLLFKMEAMITKY